MRLTKEQFRAIAGPSAKPEILDGLVNSQSVLDRYGISKPHRLAHFISQIAHESARFATTTEYASGAAYEGRKDLGNTQSGDGKRFRGRGLIQLTGRANARDFSEWAKSQDPQSPNFEATPIKLADFPWALLSGVWFWNSRNLSAYADANNIEMITRRINGGLNGYADRLDLYTRAGLVILGYKMEGGVIAKFQKDKGLKVDDIAGPATRAAIHKALTEMDDVQPQEPVVVPPTILPTTPVTPSEQERSLIQIILDLIRKIFK